MSRPAQRPRVAVVGGSLGGLTAALVLRDVGCDVVVFERSTAELEARGAGIAVLDATVRYFVEHRVLDVDDVCIAASWLRYLEPDGSTRYEERRRYRFSSWTSIYRALLGCFGRERYLLGIEVVGFEQDQRGVAVRLSDGGPAQYDLLVCAEGIGSETRRRLLPDVAPRYAGYVAWRGTLPESRLSARTFERLCDAITYQLLPNSHILVYPIPSRAGDLRPGRRLANFVWYRNVAAGTELDELLTDGKGRRQAASVPPGTVREPFVREMRAFAEEHLAPPISEVVLKTADPFVQVIYDIDVPKMAFGRVCLIGDAAFAVRPHAAAGTAKAAADGWALAEAMAATGLDVPAALRQWEPRQLSLGRQVLLRAREIGDRSQFKGTWVPGDPYLVFGLHGPGR